MVRKLRKTQAKAWFIPMAYAATALTLGFTFTRLAQVFVPGLVSTISANAAIGIYSSIASGMLALTGMVFSLIFVMVQFSATAYSPRLVLWLAPDPVMSHATGVFCGHVSVRISCIRLGRIPILKQAKAEYAKLQWRRLPRLCLEYSLHLQPPKHRLGWPRFGPTASDVHSPIVWAN
jgi:hypothetical protein